MAPETWEKMSSVRLGPGNTEGEHSSLTLGFPTGEHGAEEKHRVRTRASGHAVIFVSLNHMYF